MKKTLFCLVAVAAMALGFTSCSKNPGTIEVKYGFVSADDGGITNGPLAVYALVNAPEVYNAFETAFKSESGYQAAPLSVGECSLLNQEKLGHRAKVMALALKGWANVPEDFQLTNDQKERTFRVIYRFVGDETTEWEQAFEFAFPKAAEE